MVASELSATEIMERNFRVTKVSALRAEAVMVLEGENGARRERRMALTSRLQPNGFDSNVLIRFLAPGDIRGTGFLQIEHAEADDDLWVYLPALKKSRRLVANNKRDSFFGSDFAYGDILPPRVSLYQHELEGSDRVEGQPVYVIRSTPANAAVQSDSGYGYKRSWIRQDSFLEAKVEYFDSDGHLIKTQISTHPLLVEIEAQRWIATRREMVNHVTRHRTLLTLNRIEAGGALLSSTLQDFSVRTLERE